MVEHRRDAASVATKRGLFRLTAICKLCIGLAENEEVRMINTTPSLSHHLVECRLGTADAMATKLFPYKSALLNEYWVSMIIIMFGQLYYAEDLNKLSYCFESFLQLA